MNLKGNKGITLIALIITIIVLLILAGVTINMVLGDDGIISQAQATKEAQKEGRIKEAIETYKGEQEISKYEGSAVSTPRSYETFIDDLYSKEKLITEEQRDALKQPGGEITIGKVTISKEKVTIPNAIATTPEPEPDVPAIGDYVEYEPTAGTYTSYGMELSTQTGVNALKWQYLGVNASGNIMLISDRPTDEIIIFEGKDIREGLYSDVCELLYSNSAKGKARSVKLDDFDLITNGVDLETLEVGSLEYNIVFGGQTSKYSYVLDDMETYEQDDLCPGHWYDDTEDITVRECKRFREIIDGKVYTSGSANSTYIEKCKMCGYPTESYADIASYIGLRPVIEVNATLTFGDKNDQNEWKLVAK